MTRSISDSSCGSATPRFSVMTKPDLTEEDYGALARLEPPLPRPQPDLAPKPQASG
jgi:hypothetical protein